MQETVKLGLVFLLSGQEVSVMVSPQMAQSTEPNVNQTSTSGVPVTGTSTVTPQSDKY